MSDVNLFFVKFHKYILGLIWFRDMDRQIKYNINRFFEDEKKTLYRLRKNTFKISISIHQFMSLFGL